MISDTAVCAIAAEDDVEIDFNFSWPVTRLVGRIPVLKPGRFLVEISTCKLVVEQHLHVRKIIKMVQQSLVESTAIYRSLITAMNVVQLTLLVESTFRVFSVNHTTIHRYRFGQYRIEKAWGARVAHSIDTSF